MEELFLKFISLGSLLITFVILMFFISILFKQQAFYVNLLKRFGLQIVFLVSLFATVGSLLMSIYFTFPPCDLCWYQRVFMYPVFFISAFALFKKEFQNSSQYIILLSVVGGIIALYHYFLQILDFVKNAAVICSPNAAVDCSIPDFVEFGFVTTPFISLSIFVFVIICSLYASRKY